MMIRSFFLLAFLTMTSFYVIGQDTDAKETVFKVVEEKPIFPGCEEESTKMAKEKCSNLNLMNYIIENLKYPSEARKKGFEGMAVVSFIVERDGSIGDAKIEKNPGEGLGEEGLRVVQKMNADNIRWRPGYQRGKPVRVHFNLPLNFKLDHFDKPSTSTAKAPDSNDKKATYQAPRFPGCEEREMPDKFKYLCSQKKLVNYLDRYINYPKEAAKATVQGKVIVSFIVETDGSISNPAIIRSPSESLGAECLGAIDQLSSEDEVWLPAYQDGIAVRSRVEVPINFRLGYKSIKSKKPITYVNIPNIMPSEPVDDNGKSLVAKASTNDASKVYDDPEESPYFKSCRTKEPTLIERYKCSRAAYMAYVRAQIEYPEVAQRNRVQGIAKVECIVELDGSVSNPRLLRDPGSGLGEEAIRIITEMKDSIGLWTPGTVGGEAVRTKMELPITFRLSDEEVSPLVVVMNKQKTIIHDCIRTDDVQILQKIDGAKVKELSKKKAQKAYGEKGRYGVYQVRLPKGKGRLPKALRYQEEVEAYEMYYDGLILDFNDEKQLQLNFEQLNADAKVVVYTLSGRTYLEEDLSSGTDITKSLDLSDARGQLLLVSITQKDLVHTQFLRL